MTSSVKRLSYCLVSVLLAVSISACSKGDKEPVAGGEPAELTPSSTQQAEMLETALKNDPNNTEVLAKLGNLYFDQGLDDVNKHGEHAQPVESWTKGIGYYKRALEVKPSDVNVRVDMGTLLEYLGKTDEAISEYRRGIRIDPKHPQARINLIIALGKSKKDYKSAVLEYEALLKAVPEQAGNKTLELDVEGYKQMMKGNKK